MSRTFAYPAVVLVVNILSLISAVTSQGTTSLPALLKDNSPPCAESCIRAFISDNLWGCPDASSLDCLCRTQGANGYTIGEGALACIADKCPFSDVERYAGVRQICNNQPDAAPVTHLTLTAAVATATVNFAQAVSTSSSSPTTLLARTTSSSSSSTTTHSSISSTSSTSELTTTTETSTFATSNLTTSTTSSTPVPSTASSTIPANSTLAQNAAASTSAGLAARPVLNGGQIAGISVAGVVLSSAAVSLLFFIFCGKKYKQNKHGGHEEDHSEYGSPRDEERGDSQGSSFAEQKPETPIIEHVPAPPRSLQGGPKAHQFLGLPVAPNQHRQSWWNKFGRKSIPQPPPPIPTKPSVPIGVARYLTPTMGGVSSDVSPKSAESYHTTSKLLPEKPAYQPGMLQVHEKRCSDETARGQPGRLATGIGLRVINATPEQRQPQQPQQSWQQEAGHRHTLQQQHSGQDILKGKLSDPFIARSHDQLGDQTGLVAAFRASRNQLPKINTFGEQDARSGLPSQAGYPSQNISTGLQADASNRHESEALHGLSLPPQLPETNRVSPLTPGFAAPGYVGQPQDSENYGSMMNRPRGASSPFFSSQPSQFYAHQKLRREKRRVRPETHYTTSSETEFEDDDPSPVTPRGQSHALTGLPTQNTHRPHISVGGVAELSGLSPVTESPISKKTPSSGRSGSGWAPKTPSPRVNGNSASRNVDEAADSDTESAATSLSRIRYPEIPGSRSSPMTKINSANSSVKSPRSDRSTEAAESSRPTLAMPPVPKLEPSPLRPSRPAQLNLREIASAQSPSQVHNSKESYSQSAPLRSPYRTPPREIDQPELAELPSPSEPSMATMKFHSAASRLAASSAGLRGPAVNSQGLGNWPVQPVRPVTNLRNTRIPAPIGVAALAAGSQPATPIDETFAATTAISRDTVVRDNNNAGTLRVVNDTERDGYTYNPANGRGSDRVLIPGPGGRAMHAPALVPPPSQTTAGPPYAPTQRVLQPAFDPQRGAYDQNASYHRNGESSINNSSAYNQRVGGWGNPSRFIYQHHDASY